MRKVTELEIMQIEDRKSFGRFVVQRNNMEEFTVIENKRGIFTGTDEEVADYLNEVTQ